LRRRPPGAARFPYTTLFRSGGGRALVGDRPGVGVGVGVAARRRREGGQGEGGCERPPQEALTSSERIVSPTWILSITSIPDVTCPKWLYTPLEARNGASPSVTKNCDPLTPAALEAIPSVPRGHFDGFDSSGSL